VQDASSKQQTKQKYRPSHQQTGLPPLPGFKVKFFLPFGFCPPKVGPVVYVSFLWGEICAEFLFVFPLMGKAERGGNPVC